MALADLHGFETISAATRTEVDRLLVVRGPFCYTAGKGAPVTFLEPGFSTMTGRRFALTVSSCSTAPFLASTALDMPRGAHLTIAGYTFAAVPFPVFHDECLITASEVGRI